MPEYLAPGVFMEEVSYRAKSIEGVSTTTTGFVGPARFGPIAGVPELVTSYAEFETTYGDDGDIAGARNFLALGVRAFFEQGGKRLYVSRVVGTGATAAKCALTNAATPPTITARHPGEYGEFIVRVRVDADADLVNGKHAVGLRAHDVVLVTPDGKDAAWREVELLSSGALRVKAGSPEADAPAFAPDAVPNKTKVQLITASLTVIQGGVTIFSAARLALKQESASASLERALDPGRDGLSPVVFDGGWEKFLTALNDHVIGNTAKTTTVKLLAADTTETDKGVIAEVQLGDGGDGSVPDEAAYKGQDGDDGPSGLAALEHIPEISIVAAPAAAADAANHAAVCLELITHVERMRYRVAVLDAADDSGSAARALRAGMDSTRAALYFPWVKIADPAGPGTLAVPPSGFVAGIYARNDVNRGVWKAPANEVVLGALGFSKPVNTGRQEVLNPLGVNCLRSFEGRGHRVWGGRTISSDPEWKYLNVRRYFNYLERSIELHTQWAVFESNSEQLWGNVRRTIQDFLLDEFQKGALLGDKPEAAYFVKCDRSTMTQNDLDNGRLVVLVGVAAVRPAEFVIFRIGQWTNDRRS